jgi:biopolymer transport protein ExbB
LIGLLDAFTRISSSNGLTTPADVAQGVYQSLITAALGLVVAIPAYLGYAFLSARARALMHDLERAGIEIVNLIEDSKSTSNIVEFHQVNEAPGIVPMTKTRTRGLKN